MSSVPGLTSRLWSLFREIWTLFECRFGILLGGPEKKGMFLKMFLNAAGVSKRII